MATKKSVPKMRITVKSFDYKLLDEAVKKIVLIAKDS